MFELIYPGWLAGIFLSFATGPLGACIVWRRISSFGDTLCHSSILGLAISILFEIDSFYTVLSFMSVLAIILAYLENILSVSLETILSIISHSALSLGIILISLMSFSHHIDLSGYLFGDLLIVTIFDLCIIASGSLIVLFILFFNWNSILLLTINEELAQIDGVNIFYTRLILMLTTALSISIAIKFVGVLLVTSLLIIPPSIAQIFSNSPEKMVFLAILISFFSITGGIFLSFLYNTPTSPSIVLFSSFLYLLSNLKKIFYK